MIHVRQEAAAVHMADAWGRLTGEPGIALVTAGPGMANTLSAMYVAKMAESPLLVLGGHAPHDQLGRGAFQEMPQTEMAEHVAKASWTATQASQLGHDIARAIALAKSGRPGPVYIGLPADLLEAAVEDVGDTFPNARDFRGQKDILDVSSAEQILDVLSKATKPLILAGPAMMRGARADAISSLADVTHVPVVSMESPRGTNDPSLGAFAEVVPEADLIVLLAKKLDFTLPYGGPASISPECRFIQFDPDIAIIEQTQRVLNGSSRLVLADLADPLAVTEQLVQMANQRQWSTSYWYDEVGAAIRYRPSAWSELQSPPEEPLHAVEVCRAVQKTLNKNDGAVFISDGGEFGQWAQACLSAPIRIINGPSGAIGSAIPFALAARLAFPGSSVVTMLGDGTFGFHGMEFDTAVRHKLPFVAVVGNDSAWNAEYQIQLRKYGESRLIGCELLPSRYHELVKALDCHGEHVSAASELQPALERALASGRPACVNVAIQRIAAPVIRRNV